MTSPDRPNPPPPGNDEPAVQPPRNMPEPPDLAKVRALRERMKKERPRAGPGGRGRGIGGQVREIGTYTIIPMMMIAGPLVGYLLGRGFEKIFGGEPWPAVVGLLFGLVAGFRQVFLLLAERAKRDAGR